MDFGNDNFLEKREDNQALYTSPKGGHTYTTSYLFGGGLFWKSTEFHDFAFVILGTIHTLRKHFCDREKLLKLEAEGWEFANFLRLLEQYIRTVKGPRYTNSNTLYVVIERPEQCLVTECFFNLSLDVSHP